MEETILLMTFVNVAGDKTTIRFNGVRPNITKAEVDALGNHIVDKTILAYKNSNFAEYASAQIQTILTVDL